MTTQLTTKAVAAALAVKARAEYADAAQRFFKTGPGQYGEGDIFIGLRVPDTRLVCKAFRSLPLAEISKLLDSPIHEHRLAGLLIAVAQFKKASLQERTALYTLYLDALARGRINNWDLIDTSCGSIMGEYLWDKPKDILPTLAASPMLWERRASIMATFTFIMHGDAAETYRIAILLMHDSEDLIHKAVGWMLRETGKRVDRSQLLAFLDEYAAVMPRTMLRYAIEHLDTATKQHYMTQKLVLKRAS